MLIPSNIIKCQIYLDRRGGDEVYITLNKNNFQTKLWVCETAIEID